MHSRHKHNNIVGIAFYVYFTDAINSKISFFDTKKSLLIFPMSLMSVLLFIDMGNITKVVNTV